MANNNPKEALRQALRSRDPAREERLTEEEAANLRMIILQQAEDLKGATALREPAGGVRRDSSSDRSSFGLAPALASVCAAVLLAVALSYSWSLLRSGELGGEGDKQSNSGQADTNAIVDQSPEGPRTRQVNFVTPGGTRVVWQLTSDFEFD